MDNQASDKQNTVEVPPKQIGTIAIGEKPRTASIGSYVTRLTGYVAAFLGGAVTRDIVSDISKENVSAHDIVKGEGFVEAFQKGLNRVIDLKLWKSNLANIAVVIGGFAATEYAVKKVEQHTFEKRHGILPKPEQLNDLMQKNGDTIGNVSVAAETDNRQETNWQDKTKSASEQQQSTAR